MRLTQPVRDTRGCGATSGRSTCPGHVFRVPLSPATVRAEFEQAEKGAAAISDIGIYAQILSSLATLVVASGILYQGRQARKARDDEDRPQIIVDADYTGRFTTNI